MKHSSEIEAVVRRFLAARTEGDVETVRNLHSDSEHVRLIGSDDHEWYQGPSEVVGIWEAILEEAGYADVELLRLEAFENGDTGWAAVEQRRHLENGDSFLFRITLVLQIEAGSWRVTQLHYSVPVANEETFGVELTRSLSGLLTSLDTEAESSELRDSVNGTATIVFTDIVDSTALSQSLGDTVWAEVIADHFRTVHRVVEHEGGTVVKTLGDGGMFVFPSAGSALTAAAGIQREASSGNGTALSLRVGIHTGDVVRDRDDYLGLTVNKAARVAAAAVGGQILVSSTTKDMVNTREYEFGDPISTELKGIEGIHVLRPLDW